MKIFITGATGFIGVHLTRKLAEEGHTVHALCRTEEKSRLITHPGVRIFYGHILNEDSLIQGMEGCDVVFHLAAYARVWSKDPNTFYDINVKGTTLLLDCALTQQVKKVIITSTAGVFGPSVNGKIINEDTVRSNDFFNEYERTKSLADKVAEDFRTPGLDIMIVHPTRVFGPGLLSQSNSVSIMIDQYIRGKWHIIPGNGKSIGNYVYVDDVVKGHMLALENGHSGEHYLLGGDNVSYNDFFRILKEVSGEEYRLHKLPLFIMLAVSKIMMAMASIFNLPPLITPGFVRRYVYNWNCSTAKAKNELGYSPITLAEGMKKTIQWLEQNK
ncbi:MAG: SDR family oxidoreductase [Bacteroidales bacterium]|nr:SDR family oxidoreductase [Bacteroidales bacterium]